MCLVGVLHKRHQNDTTVGRVYKNSQGVLQNFNSVQAFFKIFLNSRQSPVSIHPRNGIQIHRSR